MKKIIAGIFLLIIISCKKDDKVSVYHLPNLIGTTWYAYSFTGSTSGTKYYDYLHFTSENSVDLYTSDIIGQDIDIGSSGSGGITTCSYKITSIANQTDSFDIFFKNGSSAKGMASDNSSIIIYQGVQYVKK